MPNMICCLDGHSGLACGKPGSLMCCQDHLTKQHYESVHLHRSTSVTRLAASKPLFRCAAAKKPGAMRSGTTAKVLAERIIV